MGTDEPAREPLTAGAPDGDGGRAERTDRLARYRALRDFARTPEPTAARRDAGTAGGSDGRPRFVLQQHDATRLHWDLRLEHQGVLLSWALPRGVPWNPAENRLAVHTEDHPLEYLTFEGEIPEGEYGAGGMVVWDDGTYEAHELADDKLVVTLQGRRVQGRFALFATRGRDWMIHRMDPPQDPERQPLPSGARPMRATPGELPTGTGWAFEIRWTGIRAVLSNDAGRVVLHDADGTELTSRFPEVRRIGRALAAVEAVLDGVLVATSDGRPVADDTRLGHRLGIRTDSGARRAAAATPVAYLAVDLLWLEGHPTVDLPYGDRRELLAELALAGPAWQVPSHHCGDGAALLRAARGAGQRGLVAKRLLSRYRQGERSPDWVEVMPGALHH